MERFAIQQKHKMKNNNIILRIQVLKINVKFQIRNQIQYTKIRKIPIYIKFQIKTLTLTKTQEPNK